MRNRKRMGHTTPCLCRRLCLCLLLLTPHVRAGYEEDYQAASDLWNTDKAAAIHAFVALAGKADDPAQASDCLRRAAKLIWYYDRKDFDRSMDLARHIPDEAVSQATQMWVLNQHGKRDELLERFRDAPIETWPLDVRGEAFRIRGNAWRERGEGQRAAADLQRAAPFISLDLWKAGSYLDLGNTYRDLLKNEAQAIAAYRQAFAASRRLQTRVPAAEAVADLLIARGEADAAVEELRRIDVDSAKTSRYGLAYLQALGRALTAAGRHRAAVTAYREALGITSLSDALRAEIQADIEQLMLGSSEDIVLAARAASPYQVVTPDRSATPQIGTLLHDTAVLMRSAFETNGFALAVVTESTRDPEQPAIYLGATEFARTHGVPFARLTDWSYVHKVIGRDVIIAGNDLPDGPLATIKGVTDFMRIYARARFVGAGGAKGIEFPPTPVIAVPADLDRIVARRLRFLSPPAVEAHVITPPLTAGGTLYTIANNYFPATGTPRPDSIPSHDPWTLVVLPGTTGYLDLGTAPAPLSSIPQCSPLTAAQLAGECITGSMEGLFLDGLTNLPGLNGPVRYVFGRMFDRAEGTEAKDLLEEYYEGAFRETASTMRRFFDALYHPIQLYNRMPRRYTDVYGQQRSYLANDPARWLILLYPANAIADLETHLVQAEQQAVSTNVKHRLAMVRSEFDRLRRIATHTHIHPVQGVLTRMPSTEVPPEK